ncbi:MAG: ASKHA domain-containing protein [Candidatus Omnitrophica bacterium]|nr:ASKHA domain-containing protein [Candidatus Omnitrophota bacterium]MDD5592588.1 ASKHA domain-containing protein [Candidatus Omnitrophota bacterium]
MEKFKVTFYPENKSVEVAKDTTILSAAISAGAYLNSSCGGDGVCGRCKVILKQGQVITQPSGRISHEEKRQGVYLACLTTIQSDLGVEIPAESRMDLDKLSPEEISLRLKGLYSESEEIESVASVLGEEIFTHSPLATKLYLELPPPDLEDKISDLERLYRQINRIQKIPVMQTGLSNIRRLGELLRSADWKVTVTLGDRNGTAEIVLIEPGDTSSKNFGFSFDIGTTTISGQLVDLNTKKVLGTKASYNKQASFGSDIITRIIYAQEEDGLEKLHHAVVDEMNQMIHELTQEHNIDLNDVNCILCAGNTTMIHLLLRVDPTYIRREPYVSTANFVPTIRAAEAGIKINPRGLLSCVPGVASYAGGDVTAGVLSCGLDSTEDLSLLIDVGTNGEIVLGSRDFLISASASAGPAFEGSGVSCGMRSSRGAIQKVKVTPKDFTVTYNCIAETKPRGICGSGYIDILAQMLRAGLLDKNGKIKKIKHERIREGQEGSEFIIAFKRETDTGADIVITETDIENLKRAKAAIYSAVAALVRHMDLDFSRIKKIFIAGGFGTYIDVDNAVTIGLLPDLERSRFIFVGNSSLAGARQILLSYEAMKKADEIAKKITYFELSVEPGYMDEYIAALFFPHTDLNKFPTVKI